MRIVAAILLIVIAVVNGVAAAGFTLAGGIVAAAGTAGEELEKQTATGTAPDALAPDPLAPAAKPVEPGHSASDATHQGKSLALFGMFLFAVAALELAGATAMLLRKGHAFVLGAAAVGIVAEVWGGVTLHFGLFNVIGLIGCALAAVVAWRAMAAATAAPRAQFAPRPAA
jgi:hypothetical protein